MPSRLANSTPATSRTFDRRFTMPSRMGSANAVKIDTSSLVDEFTPHVKGLPRKDAIPIVKWIFDNSWSRVRRSVTPNEKVPLIHDDIVRATIYSVSIAPGTDMAHSIEFFSSSLCFTYSSVRGAGNRPPIPAVLRHALSLRQRSRHWPMRSGKSTGRAATHPLS